MEKCTYCVQMVERAKIRHKSRLMKEHPGQPSTSIHVTAQDMLLPDGAAQTACQLACPMGAITFGNVLDPAAAVFRAKSLPRTRISSPAWARLPARATWFRQETPIRPWRNATSCPEIDKKRPFIKE